MTLSHELPSQSKSVFHSYLWNDSSPNAGEVGHNQVVLLSNQWPSLLHPNTRLEQSFSLMQSILPLNTRLVSQENNWKGSKQHHLLVFKSLFSSESYERKWKQKHKNFQQSSVQKALNTYISSKIKKYSIEIVLPLRQSLVKF